MTLPLSLPLLLPLQTSIFDQLDLVAVLNTGATGFAVVMLFISYRLIAGAQTRLYDKEFPGNEVPEGWPALVGAQVRQTYVFMALSAVFFLAGLGALIWQHRAESEIVLTVQPYEAPFPQLFVQGEEGVFKETGHAQLRLQTGRTVEIRASQIYTRVSDLEAEMARLETELSGVRDVLRATAARAPTGSGESGL